MKNMKSMKSMKHCVLAATLIGALALSGTSLARGTATGTIDKLTTSGNVTNIFLSNDSIAISGESRPACATRRDFFTLATDQKNQLALVLTAYALGQEINIKGNDLCTNKSNAEDAAVIQLLSS